MDIVVMMVVICRWGRWFALRDMLLSLATAPIDNALQDQVTECEVSMAPQNDAQMVIRVPCSGSGVVSCAVRVLGM